MPEATLRIMPARSISFADMVSASAGASRSVGRKRLRSIILHELIFPILIFDHDVTIQSPAHDFSYCL